MKFYDAASSKRQTFRMLDIPKIVGSYVVCENFYITANKKPAFFHRIMTKLLLGWQWVWEQLVKKEVDAFFEIREDNYRYNNSKIIPLFCYLRYRLHTNRKWSGIKDISLYLEKKLNAHRVVILNWRLY